MSWTIGRAEVKFLSTPSARRATHDKGLQRRVKEYFYPRPPRGGRRQDIFYDLQAEPFLSTPSARRATVYLQNRCFCLGISIHALREEGDVVAVGAKLTDRQFLSTPSARRAT